jgi:Metal binding domain of Ada
MLDSKKFRLIDGSGKPIESDRPGTLGGHKRLKGYGRLDCPSALRWISLGHYVHHRVFFADETTAISAGYRPCARCLPERYRLWRTNPAAWRAGAYRNSGVAPAP